MKFSFRQVLPFSFSLNILLVVGTITLLTRWQGQKVVEQVAQQWQEEMGRHIETHLRSYLQEAENLNQSQKSLLANELVSPKDLPKIETFLAQQLQASPNLFYTAWANIQGDYLGIAKSPQGQLKVETAGKATDWQYRTYTLAEQGKPRKLIQTFPFYDPRTRPWYQIAVQKQKSYWSAVYFWFDHSQLALDAVMPIYNPKGELLGVADTPLPLQQISLFLSKISSNYSGKSFISDRHGNLIASSIQEPLFTNNQGTVKRIKVTESNSPVIRKVSAYLQPILNNPKTSQQISTFIFVDEDQRKFIQIIPFKYGDNIDWLICLILPESNFINPLHSANRITLIVSMVALITAIVASMAIARWIYKPILDIYQVSLEIASGNRQKRVAISSSYELAQLGKAFNQMADELKIAFENLEFKALHDSLTYLPNRNFLNQQLSQLVADCKKDSQINYAVIFLDLDDFKIINDSQGHLVGDELLKQVAHRLRTSVHPQNLLARFGGDEFVIVMSPILNHKVVLNYAERLLQNFKYPFFLEDRQVTITASVGIAFSSMGYEYPQDILRDASIAVFQAKRNGKNCYQVMTGDLQLPAIKKLQIITELKQALKEDEFCLYFQPIMSLKNGQLAGFETLIRWQHPQRGLVFPDEFIAIAEESGLILEIDLWVLEAVCQQLQQWQQQLKITVPLMLSLNFSPLAVKHTDTLERVRKPLENINFKPWQLKLEVTETSFMDTFGSHRELLENLQALDLEFCLDDFGTGHSSLSRLQQLPVHTLKIDRSFVLQLESEKTGVTMVKTIINLAHDLGMSVVVEGIETESQERTLKRLGCDYAQGFFFARPLPVSQATDFLSKYFARKAV